MNKLFFAAAVVCLFAFAAFAQKPADFSGKWTLDMSKSDLGQQASMIKSQTMTITQAGTSFKVSTQTERNAPPDGGGGAGMGGGGNRGGGGGMGGGGEQSYTLDGKEVSTERQTPNGAMTTKTTASQTGNKVVITSIFPGPNGEIKSTTTYELSADGKSLTVTRESMRGTTKSVYTKG
jgi:hypothetical protein